MTFAKAKGSWDLSGVSGKKKAPIWSLSFIAAWSHYVIIASLLTVGHTKAIQLFRLSFNSKFSCLFCLSALSPSVRLLG